MVYNEAAPISALITYINTMAGTALTEVAGTMITTITPIGTICFGIYIIVMMWGYMRGAESDPVQDFLVKFFSWSLVIGYGLNAETYTNEIMPIVTGLGESFLKMFGGGANATAMDTMFLSVGDLIGNATKELDAINAARVLPDVGGYLNLLVCAAILIVGVIPFMVVATVTVIVASLGAQIVAAVGPLFFLALLFPATRQYFSSWLNTALSYAFIPLFVAIISMLAISASAGILDLQPGETILTASFSKLLFAAFVNWVFLFMVYQVSSLASSLSSGGINAGMPRGGVGGIASAIKSGVSGTGREVRGAISGYKGAKSLNHARLDARRSRQNQGNSIKKDDRPRTG